MVNVFFAPVLLRTRLPGLPGGLVGLPLVDPYVPFPAGIVYYAPTFFLTREFKEPGSADNVYAVSTEHQSVFVQVPNVQGLGCGGGAVEVVSNIHVADL